MTKYRVEPKSRNDIRIFANMLRRHLRLDNVLYVPVVKLLDVLPEIFDTFSYEIVPEEELPDSTHADTDIITGHIRIKESVYERACDGGGRDRMTIAHEIGHYFLLCCCGFKLQQNYGDTKVKTYEDPEWQAKCFAGEFMIPRHLIGDMNPWEIANACGVSFDAAAYQYNQKEKGVMRMIATRNRKALH